MKEPCYFTGWTSANHYATRPGIPSRAPTRGQTAPIVGGHRRALKVMLASIAHSALHCPLTRKVGAG